MAPRWLTPFVFLTLAAAVGCALDSDQPPPNGVVVIVEADATIRSDFPANNYGSFSDLTIERDDESVKDFLIRFVVSGVGERRVEKATLQIHAFHNSRFGGHFHVTDNDWVESEINWMNGPPAGERLGSLAEVREGQTYGVDVTHVVTGDGTYSFRVVSESTERAGFRSRESRQDQPKLTITLANTATDSATETPSD
jgi:hypothetical protein